MFHRGNWPHRQHLLLMHSHCLLQSLRRVALLWQACMRMSPPELPAVSSHILPDHQKPLLEKAPLARQPCSWLCLPDLALMLARAEGSTTQQHADAAPHQQSTSWCCCVPSASCIGEQQAPKQQLACLPPFGSSPQSAARGLPAKQLHARACQIWPCKQPTQHVDPSRPRSHTMQPGGARLAATQSTQHRLA